MKKVMIVIVMAALAVGGCVPTTAQIKTLTSTVDGLITTVDESQKQLDQLVADGVVSAEDAAKINEEINRVKEDVVVVNESVKDKANQDSLEAIKAGWDATKDYNPYYGYGALGIAALELLRRLNNKNKKYTAMKQGKDKTIIELEAMDDKDVTSAKVAEILYHNVGSARMAKGIT